MQEYDFSLSMQEREAEMTKWKGLEENDGDADDEAEA